MQAEILLLLLMVSLCCYNRKYHGSESCYYVSQLFDFQKNKSYNVLVTCYL